MNNDQSAAESPHLPPVSTYENVEDELNARLYNPQTTDLSNDGPDFLRRFSERLDAIRESIPESQKQLITETSFTGRADFSRRIEQSTEKKVAPARGASRHSEDLQLSEAKQGKIREVNEVCIKGTFHPNCHAHLASQTEIERYTAKDSEPHVLQVVGSGESPPGHHDYHRLINDVEIKALIDRDAVPYYYAVRESHADLQARKSNSASILYAKKQTPDCGSDRRRQSHKSVKPCPAIETALMENTQNVFNTEQKTMLDLIEHSHSNNQPLLQTMHPLSKLHTLSSPSKRPSRSHSVFNRRAGPTLGSDIVRTENAVLRKEAAVLEQRLSQAEESIQEAQEREDRLRDENHRIIEAVAGDDTRALDAERERMQRELEITELRAQKSIAELEKEVELWKGKVREERVRGQLMLSKLKVRLLSQE
jgi:hypothetical protein